MKGEHMSFQPKCRRKAGMLMLCIALGLIIFVSLSDKALANPVPVINQPLVPTSTIPGGPDFTLTVNGTGFVAGSVVNWKGSPRATQFVSGSQLTATISASDIATASTALVTVVNPSPGGASNAVFFQITSPTSSILFERTDYATGTPLGASVQNILAEDFNGDGKLDLAYVIGCSPTMGCNGPGTISILLGNGDGTFTAPMTFASGLVTSDYPAGNDIIVGDFNRDGKLDLAVAGFCANMGGPCVSILLGNGDGTLQTAVNYPAVGNEGSYEAFSVAAGDFNRDGTLDLAVEDIGGHVSILLGNGDGTFQAPFSYPTSVFMNPYPVSVTIGDFNGDGKLDLAIANFNSSTVAILLGNGDGTFQFPLDYATGKQPSNVLAEDLNGDGTLDLVAANQNDSTVSILLGNGDGTFRPRVDYSMPISPILMIAGDFDGDGKLDLAVAAAVGNTVALLLGNGDGTFQTKTYGTGAWPRSVAAGDFTGSGRLDLATANWQDQSVSVLLQAPAAPRVPTSKEQCKDGGYQNFGPPAGPFKNQGQCISYVEHH
jgi:hypothetical protein